MLFEISTTGYVDGELIHSSRVLDATDIDALVAYATEVQFPECDYDNRRDRFVIIYAFTPTSIGKNTIPEGFEGHGKAWQAYPGMSRTAWSTEWEPERNEQSLNYWRANIANLD